MTRAQLANQPEMEMDELDAFIMQTLDGQTPEQYRAMKEKLDLIMSEHETRYASDHRAVL